MASNTLPATLTGDACRRLEQIVREDLEHATVASAHVYLREDGRIIVDELVLRLEDKRMVSLSPLDRAPDFAGEMRLDIYDDRLAGGHGWREATVLVDYAEELEDLVRVWHPEPDTVEEARL